ncbi:MAG: hypothetical protein ABS75_30775 [Pelagibacterium sp. SCN 63-23]|nr:MAG: hypothetical protein ABS75_30775 [Pelagibacterium sp. SCN 63-23]
MAEFSGLGPLGQVARSVRDIAEARTFFGDILGARHLYSFPGMAFFDLGGIRLYLQESPDAGAESVLYFQVADIAEAHAGLSAKGVVFTGAPQRVHRHDNGIEEWLAFFTDPEGRMLALIAQIEPAR